MKTIKKMCVDIKKYRHYAVYAAKADLKSEVANSYLNWIWWVLDPLSLMLVYTFIFGVVFKASEQYFAIFIFIGLTMWDFFNRGVTNSVRNIQTNKAIISKVYIPKYILLIEKMFVHAFKMLVSFALVVVMMIIYQVPLTFNILYIPLIFVVLFTVTFAIAVHLLHFGVFIMDMANIVNIVLKLLFYMSGIFYNIEERLPGVLGDILLKANPIAMLLYSMRNVLLYGKRPSIVMLLLVLVISMLIGVWGVKRIYKYENSYAKVV